MFTKKNIFLMMLILIFSQNLFCMDWVHINVDDESGNLITSETNQIKLPKSLKHKKTEEQTGLATVNTVAVSSQNQQSPAPANNTNLQTAVTLPVVNSNPDQPKQTKTIGTQTYVPQLPSSTTSLMITNLFLLWLVKQSFS